MGRTQTDSEAVAVNGHVGGGDTWHFLSWQRDKVACSKPKVFHICAVWQWGLVYDFHCTFVPA